MEETFSYQADGVAILRLGGRLNMVSAGPLRRRLDSLVQGGHPRIAVDLQGVDFIDSSGLGALISGLKTARQAGGDLRIAAPQQQVRLVLQLTSMERVLPPYASPEVAFDE